MLKYRFQKTNGSNYPDWKTTELGKITEIVMGQSPLSSSYNMDNIGLPLLQGNADIIHYKTVSERYTSAPSKICEKNDIVMTVRAPVGELGIATERSCLGRGVCAVKSIKQNNKFIFYLLLHNKNKWRKLETGSTFKAINRDTLREFSVDYAIDIEEQLKIADFLSAVDNQIEIQRQRVDVLELQKKGLLDKVFSQELRFKKDDGSNYPNWEEKQLKDVSNCSSTRKTDKLSTYISTDNMIANFGGVIFSDDSDNTIHGVEYKNNDILLSNIRPYFRKLWLSDRNGVCSSDVKVFRPNNVNPSFLYYALSLDKFFSYIMKNVTGTKMPRGNVDFMKKYKFMISKSLKEQQKIADFFTAIDNQIDIEKQRLDTMETIKKGLLQQMFM